MKRLASDPVKQGYNREYYEQHKAAVLEACRVYREKKRADPEFVDKERARSRAKYAEHKPAHALRSQKSNLRRNYGMTLAEYDALLATQNGVCAICGSESSGANTTIFSVDHDHTTGVVRGLLCKQCNSGLGMFRDEIAFMRKAVSYLEARNC